MAASGLAGEERSISWCHSKMPCTHGHDGDGFTEWGCLAFGPVAFLADEVGEARQQENDEKQQAG